MYDPNNAPPSRRRAIWAAATPAAPVPPIKPVVAPPPVPSKYICSKCGKEYKRGMYFHFKNCRGQI